MNADMMITFGLLFVVLSLPAILSAFTHGRSVRLSIVLLLGGAALIAVGMNEMPQGVQLADIPDIVTRAIARVLN